MPLRVSTYLQTLVPQLGVDVEVGYSNPSSQLVSMRARVHGRLFGTRRMPTGSWEQLADLATFDSEF